MNIDTINKRKGQLITGHTSPADDKVEVKKSRHLGNNQLGLVGFDTQDAWWKILIDLIIFVSIYNCPEQPREP